MQGWQIGLESGVHSPWVSRLLSELGEIEQSMLKGGRDSVLYKLDGSRAELK